MAKCPFMSSVLVTVQGASPVYSTQYVECITTNCQVWDHLNDRCGLMTSDIGVHVHNEHYHVKSHLGSASTQEVTGAPDHFKNDTPTINPDMYQEAPDPSTALGAPSASTLIQEYMERKDKDSNGAIFGVDFTITDPSPMLSGIINSPNWVNPVCKITMQQYTDWVDHGTNPC